MSNDPLHAMRERGYTDGKAGRAPQQAFQTDAHADAYATGYRQGEKHRVSSQS